MKTKYRTLSLTFLFLFVTAVMAGSAKNPLRHPDKSFPHEDKFGTIITWYWTFDPDNADEGWDGWTKGAWPQDPVHLKGTDITVPRNMAEKYNLEGSGWYTEDGGHRVINILEPHANPDSAKFLEVPYVDYGLDAEHFGLVPFRTVAGVHEHIPAGSWVYIPMFDGIQVPVYDLDNRWQINYRFTHDGWFRVTDISWSFASDETQIDIFAGTVQAVTEVYNQVWHNFEQIGIWNDTKQEYQYLDAYQGDVSFYYRADVPVYASPRANGAYWYYMTTDTVHHDTEAEDFKLAKGFEEEVEILCVDIDADGYEDDVLLYLPESNKIKAYSDATSTEVTPQRSAKWEVSTGGITVIDLAVGDFTNSGEPGLLLATTEGIKGLVDLGSASSLTTLSSEVVNLLSIGDINGDRGNEVYVYDGSAFSTATYSRASEALTAFTELNIANTNGEPTAITLGDLTGTGKDALFWGTEKGVYVYDFSQATTKLYSDKVKSPKAILASYVDPDAYMDLYVIDDDSLKVKYSSHKEDAPYRSLTPATGNWLTLASMDPRNPTEPIAIKKSIAYNLKERRNFDISQGRLTFPAQTGAGILQVTALNGRRLASVMPQKVGATIEYNLQGITFGAQPLIFSVTVDGARVSKVMYFR